MGSNPVSRRRLAMLDQMGEAAVFDMYLEEGSVRKVAQRIFTAQKGGKNPSHRYIYDWFHADETGGRWERWQKVKKMRGDTEFDMVLEEAEKTDETNVRSQKLRVDVHKWRAERLHADNYSPQTRHTVEGNVTHEWLNAVKQAEHEPIEEAEYEMLESGEDEEDAA